jgi:hypothetical protein
MAIWKIPDLIYNNLRVSHLLAPHMACDRGQSWSHQPATNPRQTEFLTKPSGPNFKVGPPLASRSHPSSGYVVRLPSIKLCSLPKQTRGGDGQVIYHQSWATYVTGERNQKGQERWLEAMFQKVRAIVVQHGSNSYVFTSSILIIIMTWIKYQKVIKYKLLTIRSSNTKLNY